MDDLVTTEWLARNLGEPDIAIVDASAFLPTDGRDPARRIPRGAYPRRALPRHQPGRRPVQSRRRTCCPPPPSSARRWTSSASAATTGSSSMTISPLRTAARGWFMFRHFGAERVAILDGGFQKWRAEGRPVESGEARPRKARFDAHERGGEVVTRQAILAGIGLPILDARGRARFEGSEPDPRPGVAVGHIPGSQNLPFAALYATTARFKSRGGIARRRSPTPDVDPRSAVRRQLRLGRHRQFADLRRASARRARRASFTMEAGANGAPIRRRPRRRARPKG